MAEFKEGKNYTTVWCKPKTKKVFKGENKGEEYEVYEGHLNLGGGKMLAMTFYANQVEAVETKDGLMFAVKVGKWKSNRTNSNSRGRNKAW